MLMRIPVLDEHWLTAPLDCQHLALNEGWAERGGGKGEGGDGV